MWVVDLYVEFYWFILLEINKNNQCKQKFKKKNKKCQVLKKRRKINDE